MKSEPYKCGECGKEIKDKTGFVAHVRSHANEMPFSCPVCSKKFVIKSRLTSHSKIHSEKPAYVCPEAGCGKTCRSRTSVRMHKDEHLGIKRWSCSLCDRKFLSQGNLKKHERRHGDKRFPCISCDASFFEKQELNIHLKRHEKAAEQARAEKRYSTSVETNSPVSSMSSESFGSNPLTNSSEYASNESQSCAGQEVAVTAYGVPYLTFNWHSGEPLISHHFPSHEGMIQEAHTSNTYDPVMVAAYVRDMHPLEMGSVTGCRTMIGQEAEFIDCSTAPLGCGTASDEMLDDLPIPIDELFKTYM